MKIAVVGRGSVGGALAPGFVATGHDVVVGARTPDPDAAPPQAPVADAVEGADVVVLAVPYEVVEGVVDATGPMAGTVVVDCTNPIGPGLVHAPAAGHASGGEHVQALLPGASVVKAFATVGAEAMSDPTYGDRHAFMPLCGDDPAGRAVVRGLVEGLNFEAVDVGPMRKAVHLEHLALLWITMAHESGLGRAMAMALLGVSVD